MTRALGMSVLAFDLLGGGALTGKFNKPGGPGEPTRERSANEAQTAAAEALLKLSDEIGQSPARIAINWVRQRAPHIIPILGARRPAQLADNLGILDFTLTDEQMAALTALRPLPREYPHTFWNDYIRRDLIYGRRVDEIDVDSWPAS
jgi:aryl-alcohol dehydrogenase-like predicted oxidoreductase